MGSEFSAMRNLTKLLIQQTSSLCIKQSQVFQEFIATSNKSV